MRIGESYLGRGKIDEIAKLTGTCRRTVRRWYAKGRFPQAIELLLRLVYDGDLGIISDDWHGFWIQRRYGCLVTDQGYTFAPGELRAFTIRQHYIATLERKLKEVTAERDALLADQPNDLPQVANLAVQAS